MSNQFTHKHVVVNDAFTVDAAFSPLLEELDNGAEIVSAVPFETGIAYILKVPKYRHSEKTVTIGTSKKMGGERRQMFTPRTQ